MGMISQTKTHSQTSFQEDLSLIRFWPKSDFGLWTITVYDILWLMYSMIFWSMIFYDIISDNELINIQYGFISSPNPDVQEDGSMRGRRWPPQPQVRGLSHGNWICWGSGLDMLGFTGICTPIRIMGIEWEHIFWNYCIARSWMAI